jgi:hypothetical protein
VPTAVAAVVGFLFCTLMFCFRKLLWVPTICLLGSWDCGGMAWESLPFTWDCKSPFVWGMMFVNLIVLVAWAAAYVRSFLNGEGFCWLWGWTYCW